MSEKFKEYGANLEWRGLDAQLTDSIVQSDFISILIRLKLTDPCSLLESISDSFGRPDQLMMSPNTMSAYTKIADKLKK